MSNLDRQLDALARDLAALDEAEARHELDEVEARIAADNERAARLRLILHVKQTWTDEVTVATPSGKMIVVAPQNGRRPKTRDAIVAFLEGVDEWQSVKDLQTHLVTLGIEITPEGIRQALRRLVDEDVVIGMTNNAVNYYRLAPARHTYRPLEPQK